MTDARAWMPFYVGSYLKNTRRLSPAEHGAYLLLMLEYWNQQGPLRDSDRVLSRIVGMTLDEWKDAKENLLGFFTVDAGFWRHERIDEEIHKAQAIVKRNRENGSRGGRPKTEKKPSGSPKQNPSKNTSTSTSTEGNKNSLSKSTPRAREANGREFNILDFLKPEDLNAARKLAPGWDVYGLAAEFNVSVANRRIEVPRVPGRAFPRWCASYTKGKPP